MRIEVREPIIPPPAIPVPESSSDEEPIALRRRGKRSVTVDPEEVPLKTQPRITEPSESKGQTMILPSFLETTVPIVPSPRQPGEEEESILFNQRFALKVASSVVSIPDCQYMMSGGLQKIMNDISISASQVKF